MSLAVVAFGQRIPGVFRYRSIPVESRNVYNRYPIPSISSPVAIPFSRNLSGGFSNGLTKSFLSNEREKVVTLSQMTGNVCLLGRFPNKALGSTRLAKNILSVAQRALNTGRLFYWTGS
jgi:hypothetical protein